VGDATDRPRLGDRNALPPEPAELAPAYQAGYATALLTYTAPDWDNAATERTNNLLPDEPPRPATKPDQKQLPAPPPQDDGIKPLALNNAERALLRFVATNGGITTVQEAYDGAGLHSSIGDAAKQKLLQLGMITATPIIAGSGKGTRAKAFLKSQEHLDGIILIDALRLLDELRKEQPHG
jgi:hypothetical protein